MAKIIKDSLLNWARECSNIYTENIDHCGVELTGLSIIEKFNNQEVIFLNGLNNTPYSSIFSYPYNKKELTFGKEPTYYDGSLIQISKNYQAVTQCNDTIIAATSPENIKTDGGYINLVQWNNNNNIPSVMHTRECPCDHSTSECISDKILSIVSDTINCSCDSEINKIKLTGLLCIESSNIIVFGISFIGNCSHYKQNAILLIQASYKRDNKKQCITINNDFQLMVKFDIVTTAIVNGISKQKACELNLSDMCYDKENKTLMLLTKYVHPNVCGGFIWKIKWFDRLKKIGYALTPIKINGGNNKCNTFYEFDTQPRVIACLGNNKILVAMDYPSQCSCCPSKAIRYQVIQL
jgi:hypothetical protein